jgi:hypothetical protein
VGPSKEIINMQERFASALWGEYSLWCKWSHSHMYPQIFRFFLIELFESFSERYFQFQIPDNQIIFVSPQILLVFQ